MSPDFPGQDSTPGQPHIYVREFSLRLPTKVWLALIGVPLALLTALLAFLKLLL